MGTAVILVTIMVHMQAHDTTALLNGFKMESQAEYLLPFFQREADIGFSISQFDLHI